MKLVIVTHAHPDHSGGAPIYREKYQIPIAAAENINDHYLGASGILAYSIDLLLANMVALKKSNNFEKINFKRKIKFDYVLMDRDPIPFFEDWIAIKASGHTEYDVSIFHLENKIAYIADNIISSKSSYYRPYPISNPIEYKKTLSKYISLNIKSYLLAHYSTHQISDEVIKKLRDEAPEKPRIHRTTLPTILKHFTKSFLK